VNHEHEIQLSDDLRHIVAGHSFQADPDALLQRGQRARRRSMATRGMAGIGVLAVAATGTVIGLNGSGSGSPQVQDAAYVAQHVTAVLNSEADYVYRETDLTDGIISYLDQVDPNLYFVAGTAANPIQIWDSKSVVDHHMHVKETAVNYKDHTYSTSDDKLPAYVSGPLQEGNIVDRIKQGINSGENKIVGTGDYQGHHVIKLSYAQDEMDFQLWVDSTTYQPVHSVSTIDGQTDETDLALLPRTPDLVHTMTTPVVPNGFTKVDDASDNLPHGG
jgi:hypothetical protein